MYSEKTIPAAENNLSAAIAGSTAGTIDFLRLVAAQRELIDVQEKYQEALIDYH
jgi:outer membrane protein TolC